MRATRKRSRSRLVSRVDIRFERHHARYEAPTTLAATIRMPVLEFAPPPPSAALDSPLKATTPRSTNIAPSGFLNSPRAAPPAFPSAGNDAQRTMWQERLQPSALGDDVSMELALSQETARRLSLRGGGGDDPGVATPGSEPSPYANGTQKEAPNGVDAGDAGQANGNGGLDGSDADEEELAPLHGESCAELELRKIHSDTQSIPQSKSA